MNNICHICGRDVVSPVDPVCECADEIERLEARVAKLEAENLELRQIAAHVPGKVYIAAREAAGKAHFIKPMQG